MSPEYVKEMVNYKKLIVCESFIIATLQERTNLSVAHFRGLKGSAYGDIDRYDVLVCTKNCRIHTAGVVYPVHGGRVKLLSANAHNDRDAPYALWKLTQEELGNNF